MDALDNLPFGIAKDNSSILMVSGTYNSTCCVIIPVSPGADAYGAGQRLPSLIARPLAVLHAHQRESFEKVHSPTCPETLFLNTLPCRT